jgi:hypothetical protein
VSGYHLCEQFEMYAGVYNVVRNMGWIEEGTKIWTADAAVDSLTELGLAQLKENISELDNVIIVEEPTALGVCCRDLQ